MAVNGESKAEGKDKPQQQSPIKLDVIVVGAGISGLATAISTALSGHNVTVYESAKELLEVCPNATNFPAKCATRGNSPRVTGRSVLVSK